LTATIARALADRRESGARREMEEPERLPLTGRSPAMQEIYRVIARLTRTDLTVLITGESGTGKELAAHALHEYGLRRIGPFVAVNVAAIPKELVESELFGHARGAFTGAVERGIGRFAQAEGGTLFLDEIGDMPREAQTRLLRVLQEGEFTPVGGRGPCRANVRVIAATNGDLRRLITQGLFREDLYYRSNVVPLRMPPLRERVEDIPDLVRHFLRAHDERGDSRIPLSMSHDAIEYLKRHSWPGNVRELENLVRRLIVLRPGETISAETIAEELNSDAEAESVETLEATLERFITQFPGEPGLYARVRAAFERPLFRLCLEACAGNQLRAAELLGLHRNTLRKKLREHGLQLTQGMKAE
jgi:two-component system nitrogen regulation response regulator GlnG